MSSYNRIEKVKYTKNSSDVVALKEYAVFANDTKKEKYVVFRFENNVNQRLYGLKFEVLQWDEANGLLQKSIVVHEDFEAEANASFVPDAKLKIDYDCKSITVRLIYAAFDRVKWENGEFSDNSYKFDEYAKTSPAEKGGRRESSPVSSSAPGKKKKDKAVAYSVRNVFRSNEAVFPKVFVALSCIAIFAFVLATVLVTRFTSAKFTIDGFDLKRTSSATAAITGYDGGKSDLEIPAQIGDYKITKIAGGAFRNSKVKSLVLHVKDELTVEQDAFRNCKSLASVVCKQVSDENGAVTETGAAVLMQNAFRGCSKLETIDMPQTKVSVNSFSGAKSVSSLSFEEYYGADKEYYKNNLPSLSKLFGAEEGAKEIATVELGVGYLPAGFLDGYTVKELALLNDECIVEYGALRNAYAQNENYSDNGYCEIVNGALTSMQTVGGKLVLPRETLRVNVGLFRERFFEVTALTLETKKNGLELNEELFGAFANLKTLEVTDAEVITRDLLSYCPQVTEFISPVIGDTARLADYLPSRVVRVGIIGDTALGADYLQGLTQVKGVSVAASVPAADSTAFAGLDSLEELSVPNYYPDKSLVSAYANVFNLKKAELKPFGNNRAVPEGFFRGLESLEEVSVAEGFTACGTQIVANQTHLTKVSLPAGIASFAFPTIGAGCDGLREVVVTFPSASGGPLTYNHFNNSSAATRSLKVNYATGAVTPNFFLENCEGLVILSLTCTSVSEGLLSNCRGLEYLELHATVNRTLSDLFKRSAQSEEEDIPAVALNLLIVDSAALPEGFLKNDDAVSVSNAVLVNVKSGTADPFAGCEKLGALYLPASYGITEELYTALGQINVQTVFFEAKKPSEAKWNDSRFVWERTAESLFYQF